jgi:hypothetical protein
MSRRYYDRYQNFRINNEVKVLPFIKINKRASDIIIGYRKNKTRLDIVSNTYYGTPYYGWLILSANPEYGGLEFDIPDNAEIRVPFPLISALQDYQQAVNNYDVLYSIKN